MSTIDKARRTERALAASVATTRAMRATLDAVTERPAVAALSRRLASLTRQHAAAERRVGELIERAELAGVA